MKQGVISKILTTSCIVTLLSTSAFASQEDVRTALKAGNLEEAVQAYKTLSKDESSSIDGKILWARILLTQKETEDAYDLLEELVDKNTENAELQFRFGQGSLAMVNEVNMFSKLGYAKDGVKAWTKAVEIDPSHENALKGLIGFYRVAPGIAGGDVEKALVYAEKLKVINAPAGIANLFQVYQTMEKEDLAMKTLVDGIAQYPKNSQLLYFRGINALENEQWQASYQDFNTALSFAIDEREQINVLYQLGELAVMSGENVASAIASVKKLMTLKNHQYLQWGNLKLAQLYKIQKDFVNAKSTLALVDDDNDDKLEDEVKKLKKQLKNLMK